MIAGHGLFDNATAGNAVAVLDEAVKQRGTPGQPLSDNGSQFASITRKDCPDHNLFRKKPDAPGIGHIKARVNHPQTNGKPECWFLTMKRLVDHFGDLQQAVDYCNNRRPHMSLNNGSLCTPAQAFSEKLKG